MVRVRLRDDGPAQYRNRSGVHADEDDPEVDVDPDQAAYLVDETGYFEFVEDDPRLDAADGDAASGDAGEDDGVAGQEDEPPDDDQAADDNIDDESLPFAPADHTVDELGDRLDDGDFSEDELAALEAAERDGKDRETALDAIADAREE